MNLSTQLENYLKVKQQSFSSSHRPLALNEFYATQIRNCNRMVFLIKKFGYKEDMNLSKFYEVGHIIHEYIQKNLFDKSIQKEVSNQLKHNNIIIRYRIDGLDDKNIYELKSCSYQPKEPEFRDILQLNLYLFHHPEKIGRLIYISKFNLEIIEFEINFDKEIYSKSMLKFEKIFNHLQNNTLPEPQHNLHKNCKCNSIYKDEVKQYENEK